jgi:hypothetical protein
LTQQEREELEEQSGCMEGTHSTLGVMSTMVWIWVAETMSQLKSSTTGPLFVRLLFLCQDCMAQVELLKTNLIVQLPYTYVHMLCFMVHLSNILVALSAGLTIGSAIAEVNSRTQDYEDDGGGGHIDDYALLRVGHVIGTTMLGAGPRRHLGQLYEAFQVLGINIVLLLIQPLLYQSFLVIAHALCYPYGTGICHMPTETFIQQCHYEMEIMSLGQSNHKKRIVRLLKEKHDGVD